MYTGLKHLHSYFAYLALAALVFLIIYSLLRWLGKRPFTAASQRLALIGLIFAHAQLLGGIVLYFFSPLGFLNWSPETMKQSLLRLYALEHPLMMILGIVLITIGYARVKRVPTSTLKYKTILVFYGLGLVFILSRLPWAAWLG
ncbi:MAG TPA: hypothetical protein PLE85_03140 [Bacteroidales bacterium]|nr:hypothetical protein [Bacteroidales bacterium]